ncbi:hypothetical protein TRSC58_00395 [Trypanosoma rangeli SC58]|uniref:Uncharacterized protein n=1 Tax=Trypanosoma rangeli SC58 TaxID=429131 RepID=A0A061JCJ1_TRYRA|nr:hypothetical protein TRSC58_00395 [Trypanosoma rangeli SC58]
MAHRLRPSTQGRHEAVLCVLCAGSHRHPRFQAVGDVAAEARQTHVPHQCAPRRQLRRNLLGGAAPKPFHGTTPELSGTCIPRELLQRCHRGRRSPPSFGIARLRRLQQRIATAVQSPNMQKTLLQLHANAVVCLPHHARILRPEAAPHPIQRRVHPQPAGLSVVQRRVRKAAQPRGLLHKTTPLAVPPPLQHNTTIRKWVAPRDRLLQVQRRHRAEQLLRGPGAAHGGKFLQHLLHQRRLRHGGAVRGGKRDKHPQRHCHRSWVCVRCQQRNLHASPRQGSPSGAEMDGEKRRRKGTRVGKQSQPRQNAAPQPPGPQSGAPLQSHTHTTTPTALRAPTQADCIYRTPVHTHTRKKTAAEQRPEEKGSKAHTRQDD